MNKTKLLNSLNGRLENWKECRQSSYVNYIRHTEGVELLTDIIKEIESNREDEMWGIQDILNRMKQYCELFQGKCETCFFNVTYKDYHQEHVLCAYESIKHNVENRGCENDK
jgi:hypothetical protein